MSEDVVWINVIPNPNKTADNQPDWVAPANPNAPEGKKWTIGVKIGDSWHIKQVGIPKLIMEN